jgi:hypothetical protein
MNIKIVPIICIFALSTSPLWSQKISKCFSNDGLKYRTTVKFTINNNKLNGTVASDEYDDTAIEQTSFTGTKTGNTIKVKFNGKPPVVGAASEWTNKAWTLKKVNGVEILMITFYSKDYDTNKWSNANCEFTPCD